MHTACHDVGIGVIWHLLCSSTKKMAQRHQTTVPAEGDSTVYTRILVPLDGSAVAEGALAHAASMADLFGAELLLLRSAFLAQAPASELAVAQKTLMHESQVYLEEVARRLQGRRVRTVVRWGKAAETILECAVEQKVSVVVMATQGHSSLECWPMGSVAEKVFRSMQTPVLLVRESRRPVSASAIR